MKKLIVALLFVFVGSAYAATDYQCVNDCTEKGYMYNFCKEKCSYDNTPQYEKPKQTDFQCMSDCQDKGYMYQYCKERCSY